MILFIKLRVIRVGKGTDEQVNYFGKGGGGENL